MKLKSPDIEASMCHKVGACPAELVSTQAVMRQSLNASECPLWSKNGYAWHVPALSTNMSQPTMDPPPAGSRRLCFSRKVSWNQLFKLVNYQDRPTKGNTLPQIGTQSLVLWISAWQRLLVWFLDIFSRMGFRGFKAHLRNILSPIGDLWVSCYSQPFSDVLQFPWDTLYLYWGNRQR